MSDRVDPLERAFSHADLGLPLPPRAVRLLREQTMYQLGPHWLMLERLRSSPHLKDMFNRIGAHVFEIQQPR